jgi:hypothetical protein
VVVRKPIWTSSSFLLYTGGIVVLISAFGALAYLSTQYGKGGLVAWTLIPLAVLLAVALALHRRGAWLPAGVFAFTTLWVWLVFLAELIDWWGWGPSASSGPFDGFNWSIWLIALATLAAAVGALRVFRFPLLVVFVIESVYYVVTDLVSNGGTWTVVVTLIFGLAFLAIGLVRDRGPKRPYGFWYHFAAAGQIGGALLYWWHSGEVQWSLVATASVLYVLLAGVTRRSIWAVYGVAGIIAAATHWTFEWTATPFFNAFEQPRFWVPPLVFGVVGFFIVLLGLLVGRRERLPESA